MFNHATAKILNCTSGCTFGPVLISELLAGHISVAKFSSAIELY